MQQRIVITLGDTVYVGHVDLLSSDNGHATTLPTSTPTVHTIVRRPYHKKFGADYSRWTEEEDSKIATLMNQGVPPKQIAGLLKRTALAVSARASVLRTKGMKIRKFSNNPEGPKGKKRAS